MTVTIYHDPACRASRDVLALIRNSGEEPRVVEYLKTPPSRGELAELIRRMGIPVRDALGRAGVLRDAFGLGGPEWTDAELIGLALRRPALIGCPIVATPLGVRLCRPPETVLNILPGAQRGAFRKEDGEPVIDDRGRRVDRGASD